MGARRWKTEFEIIPCLLGLSVFVSLGVFFGVDDRLVFLPVAFLGGIVTGLLSSSHKHTGNNGFVVTVVGFVLITVFSTSQHVASLTESRGLGLGDQLFFGVALFLVEALLIVVIILPIGYMGALLTGAIRKRRQPGTEHRDLRNLGR